MFELRLGIQENVHYENNIITGIFFSRIVHRIMQ